MSQPITHRRMKISPDLATKWLEADKRVWEKEEGPHNRNLRQAVVERYARDIKANRWQYNPADAICFGTDQKTIVNGQHRLWAVVEAGKDIEADVAMNVPIEAQAVMDGSLPRTAVDVMHIVHGEAGTNMLHAAVAKRLMSGKVKGALTRAEVVASLMKHEKAIVFAVAAFQTGGGQHTRGISTSTVMTVIARAWYTQPPEKLERFCKVLQSGLSESTDENVIIYLRNLLLQNNGAAVRMTQQTIYGKTERALAAYLAGERLANRHLVVASHELFPLPGEAKLRTREESRAAKKLRKKAS